MKFLQFAISNTGVAIANASIFHNLHNLFTRYLQRDTVAVHASWYTVLGACVDFKSPILR